MSLFEFLISAIYKPTRAVFLILVDWEFVALVCDGHFRFLSLYVCDVRRYPAGGLKHFVVERLDSGNL